MRPLNRSDIMYNKIEKAYAKINLNLYIINKRKDNYHNLYSDIIFADIYDTITIIPKNTKNNKINLIINGTFKNTLDTNIEENIVYKAAHYFMEKYKIDNDLVIILKKSLPVASGLGGGSADAAATLRKLTEIFNISKKTFNNLFLKKISRKLGADIPACIFSSPQTMRGIGEKIYTLPISLKKILRNNHYIILINPNVSISTELVFNQWKKSPPLTNIVSSNKYYPKIGINNLKPVAENIEPSIILIQKFLSSHKGIKYFGMSGSGATCFGIFKNKSHAIKAKYNIKKIRPKWWIKFSSINI
ncbi:MAG: 4-(cytidine 5'-diphospho)-2-C-methyl-D-erythritol kinase [Alphaproteobacteria bacterium]